MIHLFAALAEKERALISQRTKAALSAAKARGQKLGNPNISAAREAGATALKANADRHAANVLPIIAEIQKSDAKTLRAIADARGFGPFWGKGFCRTSRRTGWDSWACATAWTGTALNFPV